MALSWSASIMISWFVSATDWRWKANIVNPFVSANNSGLDFDSVGGDNSAKHGKESHG